MRNLIYFIVILSATQQIISQEADTLVLGDCYRLVRYNAPKLSQIALNEEKNKLENKKLSNQNLPQVTAFGKAWYQSEAMSVTFPPPINSSIEVNQLQYSAALNIDQKIFDGGMVSVQKILADIHSEVKNLESEVGLYQLNNVVNKYFFGIINLKKTYHVLTLKLKSLEERKRQIKSGYSHGTVKESDLDRMESEIIMTYQQMIEIELSIRKLEAGLKILINTDPDTKIYLKATELIVSDSLRRPEIDLFQVNREYLQQAQKMQNKRYVPKFSAYGQLGYSYPGLNFFEGGPAGFYMLGVKMSWNIFDWNRAKIERGLLRVNIEQINIREEDFRKNLSVEISNIQLEILKLDEIIQKDKKLIEILSKITKASTSALENGTITPADFINDLNAELKARVDYEKHQTLRLEALAQMALLKGIEII
jgi:outer membrane protein TolC